MRRRKRHRYAKDYGKTARYWALAIIVAFLLTATFMVESRLRSVVETIAEHQARVFAAKTINDAMMEQLQNPDYAYDALVHINKNADGEITSIQTDVIAINSLKARVTQHVLDAIRDEDKNVILVPVGTLLGSQLTSGRGPDLEIKVIPTGYVNTEMHNEFTSAGINQTLHQIMLRVSFQISIIIPGYVINSDVVTNYCVAETVIVGKIPDTVVNFSDKANTTFFPVETRPEGA